MNLSGLSADEQLTLELLLKKAKPINPADQPSKMVKFTNWTTEDFTWTWAKVPYTFEAGKSYTIFDYLARHFAKHLAERELNQQNKESYFNPEKQIMMDKAIGETQFEAPDEAKMSMQEIPKTETIEEKPVKKMGRPKKTEEVFEGLNETPTK